MSFEEAATLPCAAVTAWSALHGSVPVKAGDFVLVQGTGGVSMYVLLSYTLAHFFSLNLFARSFALQVAVASGATVIATSSSDDKLQKAKALGATHLINYTKTPHWDKEVLKLTNGEGVNHVIEVGGPSTIEKSLNCVKVAGHVHMIGFLAGVCICFALQTGRMPSQRPRRGLTIIFRTEIGGASLTTIQDPLQGCARPRHPYRLCCAVCIAFTSCFLCPVVSIRCVFRCADSDWRRFNDLNRALAAHKIHPVVDKVFEFEDALAAYKHLESQKHIGKVVIRVAKN